MWRIIYWVSPRTPEGGQAGKGDKTSLLHITSFRGGIYPAIAGYFQKGELWRVTYLVSPRTPEGGQAGKGDKPPPLHIPSFRGAYIQLLLATSERGNVATGK